MLGACLSERRRPAMGSVELESGRPGGTRIPPHCWPVTRRSPTHWGIVIYFSRTCVYYRPKFNYTYLYNSKFSRVSGNSMVTLALVQLLQDWYGSGLGASATTVVGGVHISLWDATGVPIHRSVRCRHFGGVAGHSAPRYPRGAPDCLAASILGCQRLARPRDRTARARIAQAPQTVRARSHIQRPRGPTDREKHAKSGGRRTGCGLVMETHGIFSVAPRGNRHAD